MVAGGELPCQVTYTQEPAFWYACFCRFIIMSHGVMLFVTLIYPGARPLPLPLCHDGYEGAYAFLFRQIFMREQGHKVPAVAAPASFLSPSL